MAKTQEFFPFCIYTIVKRDKLEEVKAGDLATFTETKAWTTGKQLLSEAQAEDEEMVLIFSDAAHGGGLIFWGVLTSISIKGEKTEYTVKELKAIEPERSRKELVLRSTGKQMSPNFIRPYAICHTPKFLRA